MLLEFRRVLFRSRQLQSPTSISDPQAKRPTSEATHKRSDLTVVQAPFGYYKSFELKVKGHPLSELSREFKIKGNEEVEEELSDRERSQLWKKMSKVKMQATRGNNDLKSNVELGRDLDLYIVNDVVGKGLPLFTPKGTAIDRKSVV